MRYIDKARIMQPNVNSSKPKLPSISHIETADQFMISNRNDHYQGIQICHARMDELGFQQQKPPSKQLPSSAIDYCYDRSSLRGSTQAIAPPPLLSLCYGGILIPSSISRATVGKFGSRLTPQADSSNPTQSKEKKSWDYDLLSAGQLVVIGWTLSSSKCTSPLFGKGREEGLLRAQPDLLLDCLLPQLGRRLESFSP
ncbi:hypothetical protein RIF29_47811 [Crotalaria pallida]|uniref:Uncharacterized protein n=1 Tax=Crotalaria pallida TaxID=3830 RepID=A0AAN9HJU4_CROPI